MKRITALTHPLIDILHSCDAAFLRERGLTAGTYGMLSKSEQDNLIHACGPIITPLSMGGSAANSIACARQLGVPCTMLGLAGDDSYGHLLHKHMRQLDIQAPLQLIEDARTGTCLSLITPDGERTMRTCLGVATHLSAEHVTSTPIAASSWILLEGYFLTASESNEAALSKAMDIAKASGVKIAFSAAAEFVVQAKRSTILSNILPSIDLLFANAGEAMLLTDTPTTTEALAALTHLVPAAAITQGKEGALGFMKGDTWHAPSYSPNKPIIDTTGAGDVFAGAFLAGITIGHQPELAAKKANKLASIVITQHGALLPNDTRAAWEEIV